MAASCSNLKRSRTELLASMSNPTRSGRLVSRLNERSLSAVERSADAVPDLSDAPEVDGCEEAVGGAVTCDEELGSAGVGAAGAGGCAGVLDWLVPEGGGGADCWGGNFVGDGAVGSCCSVEF